MYSSFGVDGIFHDPLRRNLDGLDAIGAGVIGGLAIEDRSPGGHGGNRRPATAGRVRLSRRRARLRGLSSRPGSAASRGRRRRRKRPATASGAFVSPPRSPVRGPRDDDSKPATSPFDPNASTSSATKRRPVSAPRRRHEGKSPVSPQDHQVDNSDPPAIIITSTRKRPATAGPGGRRPIGLAGGLARSQSQPAGGTRIIEPASARPMADHLSGTPSASKTVRTGGFQLLSAHGIFDNVFH